MTEKVLLQKIAQPILAAPDQKMFDFLKEKQKNDTLSATGQQKLDNFIRLSEKNGAAREQSLLALSQLRKVSVADLMAQLEMA